ncbi:MAG: (d)CMP kinase [Flavobacteriaceae bacterium]|nr:MAG: (d)CMP kinase [Flavobacteriaceae bacterium]
MNPTKNIIIAIDGYSSTGKSTLAKHIAREMGYVYVDTGAMYRAVTYYAMINGFIDENHFDKKGLITSLSEIDLSFEFNKKLGYAEIFLNGENVEPFIRSMNVSNRVSQVAAVPEVRQKLVEHQQKMALKKGIVMDGRDIGTVVFPEAELKIFMTASAEQRAKRRHKEMVDNGVDIDYQSVLENVMSRDHLDTTRTDSPLVKAADAIEIDNSEMNVDETYALAMSYVKEKFLEI